MRFRNRPKQSAHDLAPQPGGGRHSSLEQSSIDRIGFGAEGTGYRSESGSPGLDKSDATGPSINDPSPIGPTGGSRFLALAGQADGRESGGRVGERAAGSPGSDAPKSDKENDLDQNAGWHEPPSAEIVNFGHETAQIPQPYDEGRVHEDMATLVLNNPAMGSGPGTAPEPKLVQAPNQDPRVAPAAVDPQSDAAIMLRVAAGDESGFNYLVAKYHRPLIHFLFRMVRSQAVAEELAQEVFLRVYRSRESYRAEAKFTTWLYRIATNLAVNHARDTKQERSAQNVYLDAPDEETGTTPEVADDEPTVEQKLMRNERMAAIRKHVMALPDRQRMAVLMHKYQGLDYREIGEVLKLSESATKSLLFRAYQTLRDKLKEFV